MVIQKTAMHCRGRLKTYRKEADPLVGYTNEG